MNIYAQGGGYAYDASDGRREDVDDFGSFVEWLCPVEEDLGTLIYYQTCQIVNAADLIRIQRLEAVTDTAVNSGGVWIVAPPPAWET